MNRLAPSIEAGEVEALIAVTRRMVDLIVAELAALRAMRPKDVTPILEEKSALAGQYETRARRLRERKEALKALSPALLGELKQATATLDEVTKKHREVLDAAREVNGALIRTIANEVARQRNPANAYTRGARVEHVGRAARAAGPLQLDERA
ncbi:MAG: hypothetical protein AB7P52_04205 [Alphaproteobacteria bacterium]